MIEEGYISRVKPHFWSRNLIYECIEIWQRFCTPFRTALSNCFIPFIFNPRQDIATAMNNSEISIVSQELMLFRRELCLALNHYKLTKSSYISHVSRSIIAIGNEGTNSIQWYQIGLKPILFAIEITTTFLIELVHIFLEAQLKHSSLIVVPFQSRYNLTLLITCLST
jgi:hypothetical protein